MGATSSTVVETALGELKVMSFIPFHLMGLSVPAQPFVQRFLRFFGLRLHDLWQWIFRLSLNKEGRVALRIGVAVIQLRNNMKPRYLELPFPSSKKGWHRKWFYLFDPTRLLPTDDDRI